MKRDPSYEQKRKNALNKLRRQARYQPNKRRTVFVGLTAHGSQINDVRFLDTLLFSLPPNVKILTITIPGTELLGTNMSFYRFYAMIKSLAADCLIKLFQDDADGKTMRQYMTRLFSEDGTFTNTRFTLYTETFPEMVLSTLYAPGSGVFDRYAKTHVPIHDRWIERPIELMKTTMSPDYLPFILIERDAADGPIAPPATRPTPLDFQRYPNAPSISAAHKATYATEQYHVSPPLMTRYFDAVFRLSSFIRRECTNPLIQYNIAVFACRSPMYFDANKQTLLQGDYMNIDHDVFVRKEIERNASRNYRNYMNINVKDDRCNLLKF